MLYTISIFSEQFTHTFGWTLVHSLWQSTLIAAILLLFLRKLKTATASSRYWGGVGALGAVLTATIFTFYYLYELPENISTSITTYGDSNATYTFLTTSTRPIFFFDQWHTILENHLSTISLLWVLGVLFFAMRFGFGLLEVDRLKRTQHFSLDKIWEERMHLLSKRMQLDQKVRLVESALTRVPLVIGYLKPMILLPIGAVNSLPVEQVEAILAHELAHIIRKDYLVNLLQSLVEILLFFNPAVWWISTQIRIERENCCDDRAMSICTDALTYAKALLRLKEIQQAPPALSLSFGGTKKHLLHRIQRILNQKQHQSTIMEKFAVTGLLLVTLLFGALQQNEAAKMEASHPEFTAFIPDYTIDTIPSMGNGIRNIKVNRDGQRVEAKIENGLIQSLRIDGQSIAESELKNYESFIEELMEELPAPPMPPVPPNSDFAPIPPAPPSTNLVPPAPPAPPAPPMKSIKREVDKNGNTIISIDGMEDYVIEVEKDGSIIVNGRSLTEEETIILNEQGAGQLYHLKSQQRLLESQERRMKQETVQQQRSLERQVRAMEREKANQARVLESNARAMRDEARILRDEERQVRQVEREVRSEKRNEFINKLEQTLLQDGIIEQTGKYDFELTNEALKVNGKTQPLAVFDRYKNRVEDYTNTKMQAGDKIKIEVSEKSRSTTFNFERREE